MRLDHLLSKELLTTAGVRACGDRVVVSVAHCAGVCSAVGAHGWNINESNLFGMAFTGCVLVPVRQHVLLLGVGVVGNAAGVHGVGVVFGALLGPEATGPFCSNAGGTSGVSFVPASGTAGCSLCGVVVVWLTGLLFENYIVDASI